MHHDRDVISSPGLLTMGGVCHKMWRLKPLEAVTSDTSLHRCLGVFDLTFMSIGSMVGSGIYVMAGIAAKDSAGELKLKAYTSKKSSMLL